MLTSAVDRIGRPLNPAQLPSFREGVEPANKGMDLTPVPLTLDEVERLLAACGRGPTGTRHRALINLCVKTGLRDKEVRGLDLRHVDLDAGELRVLKSTAKGQKWRTLGLSSSAIALLDDWLAARATLPGVPPRSGPLFCTITRGSVGLPLCASSMRNALPKLGRRAAIEKRVHMHALRHTFAYQWVRDGKPIDVLSKALGHASLRITYRYIDHLMPADVVDTMRGRPQPRQVGDVDLAAELRSLQQQVAKLSAQLAAA